MGILDDLKRFFTREAADAKEWAGEAVADGHRALDKAERQQSADPNERMQATLEEIEGSDAAFEAIRAKADQASAKADADADPAPDADADPAPDADADVAHDADSEPNDHGSADA